MSIKTPVLSLLFVVLLLLAATALAAEQNSQDLAKASQNPIANLISLPIQNNTNFGIGPYDETQNILNIQPVWPVSLNEKWNLITRTILPVVSQPGISDPHSD